MQIEHIDRLVRIAELHQERLSKVHLLVTHADSATSQVRAIVLSQILDLATASTYLLTNEMSPKYPMSPSGNEGMMNYTFSTEELDDEIGDDYIEGDDEDEDEDPVR